VSETPTWYDVLDVPRDASSEEIREAWKTQIAELGPGERRFDALNRAAKVLLDPAVRATYDLEHPHDEAAEEPGLVAGAGATSSTSGADRPAPTSEEGNRTVPSWLLAGLAIVAAGLVAVTIWMWTAREAGGTAAASSDGSSAARDAQVAAERAVVPVLSFDYEHLEEDQRAAQALMTGKYRAEYDKLFTVLEDNAPQTRTKVGATVIASGIVRATDQRVQVLVFVDRPTTNKLSTEPVVYKDQVTLSMQLVDSEWLVDDLVTSPVQG